MRAETCPHNELFFYKTTKETIIMEQKIGFSEISFFPVCSSFLWSFFLLYSEVTWSKNEHFGMYRYFSTDRQQSV